MESVRITPTIEIPEGELRWRFSRSSGPGGQSVNTVDSRVELSFDVVASRAFTDEERARIVEHLGERLVDGRSLSIVASEHRSQLRNREAAIARLVATLRQALAPLPPPRRRTRPTASARIRRLAEKRRRGDLKRLRRRPTDDP